jgi:PIN domain nuclease of toxin-antitoxin system
MVLDASAILAYLQDETGSDVVREHLDGGSICTVNWSEVLQKAAHRGVDTFGMREDFSGIGMQVVPFESVHAEIAAALWEKARPFGLALADRACLALGIQRQEPVLTADQAWRHLDLDAEIRLLR